jgi:hypothetical protein
MDFQQRLAGKKALPALIACDLCASESTLGVKYSDHESKK